MEKESVVAIFTEDVFEEIFKTHFKELHAYAFSLVRDWESAEEIVQGMFLKLWEKQSVGQSLHQLNPIYIRLFGLLDFMKVLIIIT